MSRLLDIFHMENVSPMEEFRIEPARRFRLIAEPVVDTSAVGSMADGDTAGCETDTPDLRSPRAIGGYPDQP